MRVSKCGSRWLRVVSADGKVRYFSSSGFASVRLFWIFRNFSSLDDRVLSARQKRLIKNICRIAAEKNTVDAGAVVGTLEVSANASHYDWNTVASAAVEPVSAAAASKHEPVIARQPFAVSAMVVALTLLTVALPLRSAGVRVRLGSVVSELHSFALYLLPRIPQSPRAAGVSGAATHTKKEGSSEARVLSVATTVEGGSTAPARLIPALETGNAVLSSLSDTRLQGATIRTAWLSVPPFSKVAADASLPSPTRNRVIALSQPHDGLGSQLAAETKAKSLHSSSLGKATGGRPNASREALPSSGPPLVHSVPDLSSMRDTQVLLRAIVSPDGRVARVSVIEGDSKLARGVARAITSWRYSARSTSGDAESRIMLRILAPDVVTVSFPVSGTEIARR